MNTTIIIKPGAGGKESQDFADLLHVMYGLWAIRHGIYFTSSGNKEDGFKLELASLGEKLNGEHGIHRLCRISPHDPQRRRWTSFASVQVAGMSEASTGPIRNYVLDPYKTAEDRRKRYSTENVDDVLAGGEELDKMMEAPVGVFDIPGAEGAHFERRTLTKEEMDYALTLVPTIEP